MKNANMMLQCEECQMWRIVYSKYKLPAAERVAFQEAMDNFTYTCGAELKDLGGKFEDETICMRNIRCFDPVEKLYYSVGTNELICIHCCSSENLNNKDGFYPQCRDCIHKQAIKKRK